ncbi:unnamed protein product [Caretta caretta]
MNRCAVLGLCLLGYAGYLLLGALLVSAIERPYESRLRAELRSLKAAFLRASPCLNESALERFLERVLSANRYGVSVLRNGSAGASSWDFASAFFFSSTLVTTVGYGYTTPLSDSGKAFCIFYALLGVPFTMLVLTATVQRLARLFVHRPLEYLQLRSGYSHRALARAHFLLLLLAVLVAFFLLPAAIFSALEETWSYLDAFYFCFISLCTIGLGDYVPGEQPGQKLRALYKVSVTDLPQGGRPARPHRPLPAAGRSLRRPGAHPAARGAAGGAGPGREAATCQRPAQHGQPSQLRLHQPIASALPAEGAAEGAAFPGQLPAGTVPAADAAPVRMLRGELAQGFNKRAPVFRGRSPGFIAGQVAGTCPVSQTHRRHAGDPGPWSRLWGPSLGQPPWRRGLWLTEGVKVTGCVWG